MEAETRKLIVTWSSKGSTVGKRKLEALSEETCVCEFVIKQDGDSIMEQVEQKAKQREMAASERQKRMEESINQLKDIQENFQGLSRRYEHLESELSS